MDAALELALALLANLKEADQLDIIGFAAVLASRQ